MLAQRTCAPSTRVAAARGVASVRPARLVSCRAQQQQQQPQQPQQQQPQHQQLVQRAAAAALALPALVSASPAFALVDDRLNGDGTGLPFGVNDGILGWVIFGVLGTIWALYFTSQKDLGDFEDVNAGLKIEDPEDQEA